MDQRAMQLMALNGQIKRLSDENGELRARLGGQELIGKFLVAALTGALSMELSNDAAVERAFAIADAALKKMQGLGKPQEATPA